MSEYRLSDDAEHDLAELYRRGFWLFGERQAEKYYNRTNGVRVIDFGLLST